MNNSSSEKMHWYSDTILRKTLFLDEGDEQMFKPSVISYHHMFSCKLILVTLNVFYICLVYLCCGLNGV